MPGISPRQVQVWFQSRWAQQLWKSKKSQTIEYRLTTCRRAKPTRLLAEDRERINNVRLGSSTQPIEFKTDVPRLYQIPPPEPDLISQKRICSHSTISKDLTSGDKARQARLFATFANKKKSHFEQRNSTPKKVRPSISKVQASNGHSNGKSASSDSNSNPLSSSRVSPLPPPTNFLNGDELGTVVRQVSPAQFSSDSGLSSPPRSSSEPGSLSEQYINNYAPVAQRSIATTVRKRRIIYVSHAIKKGIQFWLTLIGQKYWDSKTVYHKLDFIKTSKISKAHHEAILRMILNNCSPWQVEERLQLWLCCAGKLERRHSSSSQWK